MPRRAAAGEGDIRHNLIQAALRVFGAQGYHATTLDRIAEEAGVSKGAVYWHFDNKLALLLAVSEEQFTQFFRYLEAVASQDDLTPAARLEKLMVEALYYYLNHETFCGVIRLISAPESPELAAALDTAAVKDYERFRDLMRQQVDAAVQSGDIRPEVAAVAPLLIIALLEGVVYQWLVDPKAVPLRELAPQLVRTCLEGLLTSVR